MKAHAPSGSVWRRAILSLAALLILASASPARAESGSLKMPSSLQRYASPARAESGSLKMPSSLQRYASPARAESGSLKMPSSLQRYASPARAESGSLKMPSSLQRYASPARAESGSLKMPSSLQRYASPAQAEGDAVAFDWTELYAGGFAGVGLADNQIVDIDGFANWGRPGWSVDYDETGGVGGLLLGKRFDIGIIPLRIELDATFGSLSADTNRLDPKDLDETARIKVSMDRHGARRA